MPLYDVECTHCGVEEEAFARISDRANIRCTLCGSQTRILMTTGAIKREEAAWYKDVNGILNDQELSSSGKMRKIETRQDYRDYVNHIYRDKHPKVQELRKRYLARASFD